MGEILRHADRYSQAFSLELYEKWQSGKELTKDERYKVENGTPWYNNTIRMAKKTVLKSLLTSGFAPLSNEVKTLLNSEKESGEAVIPDLGGDIIPEYTVDDETGEVIDAEIATEAAETPQEPPKEEKAKDTHDKPKRGRPPKSRFDDAGNGDDEAIDSFFSGVGAE